MSDKENAFLAIREAIITAAKEFLATFRQNWANESMYGFLLVAPWEGDCVEATAGTEEGLLRYVHEWLAKPASAESIQAECLKCRWIGYEDGWYENYDLNFFAQANQLIQAAHESGLMEMGDQQLQGICIEALKQLDAEQVFGIDEERQKVTIGVSDVGGDHAKEDFLGWAEQVNPPSVMERLRQDLQRSNELFEAERQARKA